MLSMQRTMALMQIRLLLKEAGKTKYLQPILRSAQVTLNCLRMQISLYYGVHSMRHQVDGSGGVKMHQAKRLCGSICSISSSLKDLTILYGYGLHRLVTK